MGLKLRKSCDLLNTLLKYNSEALSVTLNFQADHKELNCRLHSEETYSDFNKIHQSMDTFSEQSSRESMKDIMKQQEEIFKQQVRELHRLYQVQKMLMTELRCKKANMNSFVANTNHQIVTDDINKFQSSRTSSETTHSSHASIRNNSYNVLNSEHTLVHQSAAVAAGHTSLELINCSKPLTTLKDYIFQNAVDGESPESCSNDECSLDLTLRIGCASDQMKNSDWKKLSSNLNRDEIGQECTDSSSGFGVESLKRPHWLFQALSLNRT